MRTGGRILVENLLLQGADLAFCVPGESYLEVLDALYDVRDRLRLIVCRQEGGAAYMAEAYVTPSVQQLAQLRDLLAKASRPLVIAAGAGWSAEACANLRRFVEANSLPVASAFRNQDVVDNELPNYAGEVGIAINPKLAARVREADVLLVIGERLGEMVTGGYKLLTAPKPDNALIHVHPDAAELGRIYHPTLAIQSSMPAIAAALAAMPPLTAPAWRDRVAEARAGYVAWQSPRPVARTLDLWQVVAAL